MTGRISAWVVTSPEIRYLARKYRLSEYLLASINVKSIKELERIARANRITIDREYYEAYAARSDKLMFFGKPETVKIDTVEYQGEKYVRITMRFKTCAVVWMMPEGEYARREPEEWLELLRNYVIVKARRVVLPHKRDGVNRRKPDVVMWRAEKVKFVSVDVDVETARRLIEAYARRYEAPILTAFASLMGYHPEILSESMVWPLLIARALPVVSPDPIHVAEFTIQGTGKTTMALIYETALGWKYYAEVPSLASLVGDARTGHAIIARVNGVWFDEFDAWTTDARKRAEMRELIETLLTGMWQGRWQRSKGGIHTITVDNPIPVYHSGNAFGAVHPREKIASIIRSIAVDKAGPYNDRIAVAITAVNQKLPEVIQEWTLSNKSGKTVYGKPSVIRGFVEYVQRLVAMKGRMPKTIPFKARMAENYRRVYRALSILLVTDANADDLPEEQVERLARMLVEGVVIQ